MLIKMLDGGIVDYSDSCAYTPGCPTCDYGSEYITYISITLTQYDINVTVNQMYEYALSQGDMIKLFLTHYNDISEMTEFNFTFWLEAELKKITRLNNEFKVIEK